jgi:hypothetical protein
MKLLNTHRLTLEQCIEIIEESAFPDKERAIKVAENLYFTNPHVVSSIAVDERKCEWVWRFDRVVGFDSVDGSIYVTLF